MIRCTEQHLPLLHKARYLKSDPWVLAKFLRWSLFSALLNVTGDIKVCEAIF